MFKNVLRNYASYFKHNLHKTITVATKQKDTESHYSSKENIPKQEKVIKPLTIIGLLDPRLVGTSFVWHIH